MAVGFYSAIMVLFVAALWFWAEYVTGIFSNESALIALSSVYIRIQVVGYLVFSLVMVLSQCLSIVGDTLMVMVTGLVTNWGITLPIAIFLKTTNLGVKGIWWAIVVGLAVRAVIVTVYFLTGRWVKRRI
jgi:Na+-driven multidrug efflux pump